MNYPLLPPAQAIAVLRCAMAGKDKKQFPMLHACMNAMVGIDFKDDTQFVAVTVYHTQDFLAHMGRRMATLIHVMSNHKSPEYRKKAKYDFKYLGQYFYQTHQDMKKSFRQDIFPFIIQLQRH